MTTNISVSYEDIANQTYILMDYDVDGQYPESGHFREPFSQAGIAKLRSDYETLPQPRKVRWVSPEGHTPFPPMIKLFLRKAFNLL